MFFSDYEATYSLCKMQLYQFYEIENVHSFQQRETDKKRNNS